MFQGDCGCMTRRLRCFGLLRYVPGKTAKRRRIDKGIRYLGGIVTTSDGASHPDQPTAAMAVAEALARHILGELAPGSTLPSEAELASQYDVSRLTIREAV